MSKIVKIFLLALFFYCVSSSSAFASYYTTKSIPSTYQSYGSPYDIYTLPTGEMWYADPQNTRIVKINSAGEILRTIGRAGTGEGEFDSGVSSITGDPAGNLYVLSYGSVSKFDFNGGFIKKWGTIGSGPGELSAGTGIHYSAHADALFLTDTPNNRIVEYSTDGVVLNEFGSAGGTDGLFSEPTGLTTDSAGNIYVVDVSNHRVQVFQENGTFIRKFGSNAVDPSDPYYLLFPKDVEVLSNGNIVVTSQNSQKIKIFSSVGVWISEFGINGTGDSEFSTPQYLTQALDGTIWVSDWGLKRLQHFTTDGTLVELIKNNGTSDGKFTTPYSFDFDNLGNIFALDYGSGTGRVQKFSYAGDYLSTPIASGVGNSAFHIAIAPTTNNIVVSYDVGVAVYTPTGTLISVIGTGVWGAADGDFILARAIDFDSTGLMYVVDYGNSRVQVFDLTHVADVDFLTTYAGGFVRKWNTMPTPEFLFIDSSDNVYVAPPSGYENPAFDPLLPIESGNYENLLQIIKYSTLGTGSTVYIDKFNNGIAGADVYGNITGIYTNPGNQLFLTSRIDNSVYVYDMPAATMSEKIGTSGSDIDQFAAPNYAKINPVTNDLIVVDTDNHRLEMFTNGVKIKNLIPSTDVINISDSTSLTKKTIDPLSPSANSINAELYFGDYIVSDFSVDLTADRNWALVNAISLVDQSKSLIVKLNPTDAVGVSATHSLYITKQQGQTYVVICPDALTIADLSLACTNGYTLNEGDAGLTVVTVSGQEYWKITGLTGTGGLSPVINTYSVTPSMTTVPAGQSISVSTIVTNNVGLTDTAYTGTVHVSSVPSTSTLPADYTFTGGDAGLHTFDSITFNVAGTYTLTFTDTVDSARTQSVIITVTASGASSSPSSSSSSGSSSSSSSSGSSGGSSNSSCDDPYFSEISDLFQIDVTSTTAKLYFSPLPTNNFYLSFSTKPLAEEYGANLSLGRDGIQYFSVSLLKPNTVYYFKIRGQSGCRSGNWSNIMKIKTTPKGSKKAVIYYKSRLLPKSTVYRPGVREIVPAKNQAPQVIAPTPSIPKEETPQVSQVAPQAKKCVLWGLWCW